MPQRCGPFGVTGAHGWRAKSGEANRTHASQAFDKLQAYTNRRLRRHLRRRRQKSGLGRYKEMPDRVLYEQLGLAYIRRGRVRYVMP